MLNWFDPSNSGLLGLQSVGIERLGSDALINKALDDIRTRTGKDPLGRYRQQIESVGVVKFFLFLQEERLRLSDVSVEQVVERITLRASPPDRQG